MMTTEAYTTRSSATAEKPRAVLVNSCYVSRGTGVRKVSNCENDFQGYSRTLTMVPVVFDFGPFAPICENMTSSTK